MLIYATLTLALLIAGGRKLYLGKEKIIANGGAWAETFTESFIKLLGATEVICGLGIAIASRVRISPIIFISILSIIIVLMLGASFIHFSRKEYPLLIGTLVLFLMALFILLTTF
jgi:hypothetical protein